VKKLIAVAIAILIVMAFSMPALAATPPASLGTSVTVISGNGAAPVVKALWESDGTLTDPPTPTVESGDAGHTTLGVQIAPNLGFQAKKYVTIYAIVTDLAGVGNITHVYADVLNPDRSLKFEVELTRHGTDDFAKDVFDAAYAAGPQSSPIFGMTTLNVNAIDPSYNVPITKTDIETELDQQLAVKYWGTYYFDNCQLAGRYPVVINAFNNQAQVGSFEGWMDWTQLTAADFDFNSIAYGNVALGVHKQVGGDRVWNSPVAAAPIPNKATIANAGNTYLNMTVKEDDMGLGQTMINGQTVWNVHYDFRLGDGDPNQPNQGFVNYDPAVAKGGNLAGASSIPSMQILKLCSIEKVDFSIQVDKDLTPTVQKNGTIMIGVAYNAGPPTNPIDASNVYIPPVVPSPMPSP
jgi:hypothetical protein